MSVTLVVAAAGRGSRMGGGVPKALNQIDGRYLIEVSTRSLVEEAQTVVVVVSPSQRGVFEEHLPQLHGKPVTYVEQKVPNGTTGAALVGLQTATTEWSIVVWADHIGASFFDIEWFVAKMQDSRSDVYLPLVEKSDPYVYFDLDLNGRLCGFHETRKNAPRVKQGLTDCGTFLFRTVSSRQAIGAAIDATLEDQNLLSLFPQFVANGISVEILKMDNVNLTVGVNTPSELAKAHITLTDSQ
jgi:bifunctional N-acetylglucosamine-1-phosphate-uridyltransferase/glucosamine-1-phosphate-acetyltransferase GlmU-like protein